MGKETGITWVNDGNTRGGTLNPQVGCTMADPSCSQCYAMKIAQRLQVMGMPQYIGTIKNGVWSGVINPAHDQLTKLLRKAKPTSYFVGSMTDMFHESGHPDTMLLTYGAMLLTPQNFYYLLTKRPDRMLGFFDRIQPSEALQFLRESELQFPRKSERIARAIEFWSSAGDQVPANLLLGTSVGLQAVVDERMSSLKLIAELGFPVWVSAEPLIEAVEFSDLSFVDWLVVGGQSNKNKADASPFNVEWARTIYRQCQQAGTTFYFKQLGSNPYDGDQLVIATGKGDKYWDLPEDIRIQQMPVAVLNSWRSYAERVQAS